MHRVRRCRRSTLFATVLATLAALGALAGCGGADPTSTTTTSSATAPTPSGTPTPTPTLPRDVEPILVARAHHAATDLPELGNLPYALGRVLHNAGMVQGELLPAATLPG